MHRYKWKPSDKQHPRGFDINDEKLIGSLLKDNEKLYAENSKLQEEIEQYKTVILSLINEAKENDTKRKNNS